MRIAPAVVDDAVAVPVLFVEAQVQLAVGLGFLQLVRQALMHRPICAQAPMLSQLPLSHVSHIAVHRKSWSIYPCGGLPL